MAICRVCDKEYEFNKDAGYSRDLCGPLCDGMEIGKKMAELNKAKDIEIAVKNEREECAMACEEISTQPPHGHHYAKAASVIRGRD